jgi:hypothetical protein
MEAPIIPFDSMFLVISFAVLFGAVVYWLWSQIHMLQKETALVKSAVLDIQGAFLLLQRAGGGGYPPESHQQHQEHQEHQEQQPPQIIYEDLADDIEDLPNDVDDRVVEGTDEWTGPIEEPADELEPGGILSYVVNHLNEPSQQETQEQSPEQQPSPSEPQSAPVVLPSSNLPSSSNSVVTQSSLEGMSTKELRRLAEQRGVQGVHDLKKKELLSALRNQVSKGNGNEQDVKSIELTEGDILE